MFGVSSRFCVCRCFFAHNIFLKQYNIHVKYINKPQFLKDYSEVLTSRGCSKLEEIISEVEAEVKRRRGLEEDTFQRRELVKREYKPLHPHIYNLKSSFFDKRFLDLVEAAKEEQQTSEGLLSHIHNHGERIYSFPVFTLEFCRTMVEELANYEASPLPKGRPNTMNQYGIRLDELGFDDFVTCLRTKYLQPLSRLLYPEWGGGQLDSHKAFIVTYREGGDVDLSYHYDNAEVTINVALNDDYVDGELYFGPMRQAEPSSRRQGYSHQLGHGLLHRGQQLHGALPITEGVRYNLIIWLRSSGIRNALCPMCNEVPTLEPVKGNGKGDGFTMVSADVCTAL